MTSNSKRRLSAKESLVDVDQDEPGSTSASPFGMISSRRGSVIGKSPKMDSVDYAKQEQLAEKYRLIIKMSSENKITVKNSWSLDLIDNMGEMILGEAASGRRGVNFQKVNTRIWSDQEPYLP
jgi:Condensin complex subunit 2